MRNKTKFIGVMTIGALALSMTFNLALATEGNTTTPAPSSTSGKIICPLNEAALILNNTGTEGAAPLSKDCVRSWCLKNLKTTTNPQNIRICTELQKILETTPIKVDIKKEDDSGKDTSGDKEDSNAKPECRLEQSKPEDSTKTSSTGFVRICKGPNGETQTALKRLDDSKAKERQEKIKEIGKLYQNQIVRAQKSIDSLQNIIVRIKARKALMTSVTAEDAAKLDALIVKAEGQKKDADTALSDVKAKALAIQTTLTDARNNTTSMADVPTTTLTDLKKQVQEFQASVKVLKQKLIALHTTLQQTVRLMKSMNGNSESDKVKNTNSNTTTSGEEETK